MAEIWLTVFQIRYETLYEAKLAEFEALQFEKGENKSSAVFSLSPVVAVRLKLFDLYWQSVCAMSFVNELEIDRKLAFVACEDLLKNCHRVLTECISVEGEGPDIILSTRKSSYGKQSTTFDDVVSEIDDRPPNTIRDLVACYDTISKMRDVIESKSVQKLS